MTTIGVISDTHGLLRPQALAALEGSQLIVHAGDIGKPEVVERLTELAPVVAVRGNVDRGPWADAFPHAVTREIQGVRIHLLHNLAELALDPEAEGIDVVISGHSHKPLIRRVGSVLYLNPGSAGPRRFQLPVALAKLQLDPAGLKARIEQLALSR